MSKSSILVGDRFDYFACLPREVWGLILEVAPFVSLARSLAVSSTWRALVYESVTTFGGAEDAWLTDDALLRFTSLRALRLPKWSAESKRVKYYTLTATGMLRLVHITSLNLSGWDRRGTPLWAVSDDCISGLTRLKMLDLSSNQLITDAGITSLVNLETLDLSFLNRITDNGLKRLTNLTSLNLQSNRAISDAGIKELVKLVSLGLGSLDCNYENSITNEGIRHLTNLTSLNLQNNRCISDDGLRALTKLASLNLQRSYLVTEEGIKDLLNITSLNLSDNKNITIAAVRRLTNLKSLTLKRNRRWKEDWIGALPRVRCSRS